MEINHTRKVDISNLPAAGPPIRTIDELNNQGTKLITKLNHECLAKVLMHLPVEERLEMENVCKKWKEAVDSSWYTVKKLDLDDLMIPLDKKEETLKMLMIKCGRYLTHLTITDDQYPWMSYLLKDNCENIINFSMTIMDPGHDDEWQISNEDLVEIIDSMKKLKYFKLSFNNYYRQPCNLFHNIVDKLPEDIQEIHFITKKQCVSPVPARFKNLHCLTLKGFKLTNETLKGILQNNNTLTKLNLSKCTFPSDALSIFKNLNNLEHLNLFHVSNLNLIEIVSIAYNCTKVKYFEFSPLDRMADIPFNIYRELKYLNLEHLNIANHIDKTGYENENILAGMTNNWKELKYLNIERGFEFTLADHEEIKKFHKLEYISLVEAFELHPNSELLISILNNCQEFKEFGFGMCDLSKSGFFEFSILHKYKKFEFWKSNNLTSDFLFKIASNCNNLVHLELYDCNNVSEASLLQVGKLENLKILVFCFMKNLPNEMFFNFKKLEYLTFYDCPTVTDEAIIKVIDNCQKLSTLDLRKTGITAESLVYVSKRKFVFKFLRICISKSLGYHGIDEMSNNFAISVEPCS